MAAKITEAGEYITINKVVYDLKKYQALQMEKTIIVNPEAEKRELKKK
jgi:hypothetical protein